MAKVGIALLEGGVWSCLWMIMIHLVLKNYPWLLEHDYPQDVRQAADYSPKNAKAKKKGAIFAIVSFAVLLLLLILAGVVHYRDIHHFKAIFLHLWLMCMVWNVVDLIVLDGLLICVLELEAFILPGSKGCKGNRDFGFHVIGFFKGLGVMSILSLICTMAAYGIIFLL